MRIVGIVFCSLVLTACSFGTQQVAPNGPITNLNARPASSAGYAYLYGFKGHKSGDGKWPDGPLIAANGTIYGVTRVAGADEHGVVFSIDSSGNEHVVYEFTGYPSGDAPDGLLFLNGTFYGTTFEGGTHRKGTVFALSPSGSEQTLHSFAGGQDGQNPAGLVAMDGRLYGATQEGGANGRGSIYEISTTGSKRLVYSFADGADGAIPTGLLVARNHVLYGTTYQGGGTGCYNVGCGTFFSVTPAGIKTTLYDFQGHPDGAYPQGVIFANGAFYGVASGGASNEGALYTISTSGQESVLHSFDGNTDGYDPTGLISVGSNLYGAAGFGPGQFIGTVFKRDKSGTFTVIHEFAGGPHDGSVPNGAFASANGIIYGTTGYGGLDNNGTVFTVKP